MKITPLDVSSQMFKVKFRGFDTAEVENFLRLVADELEDQTREIRGLKQKIAEMELVVAEYKDEEAARQRDAEETQRRCEEMIEKAQQAADEMLERAKIEAEKLEVKVQQLNKEKSRLESYFESFLKFNIELLKTWNKEPAE
ncbi:MAG: DivIVA domain-containing protein [Syntrophales bacterium]|jgi:cell division initiation protein|nr:DivIVA domain-containing protein [Syntrophales bacterium]MDY0044093.1 DivIVA domain-containing protein [Syntrophales bacterium]